MLISALLWTCTQHRCDQRFLVKQCPFVICVSEAGHNLRRLIHSRGDGSTLLPLGTTGSGVNIKICLTIPCVELVFVCLAFRLLPYVDLFLRAYVACVACLCVDIRICDGCHRSLDRPIDRSDKGLTFPYVPATAELFFLANTGIQLTKTQQLKHF